MPEEKKPAQQQVQEAIDDYKQQLAEVKKTLQSSQPFSENIEYNLNIYKEYGANANETERKKIENALFGPLYDVMADADSVTREFSRSIDELRRLQTKFPTYKSSLSKMIEAGQEYLDGKDGISSHRKLYVNYLNDAIRTLWVIRSKLIDDLFSSYNGFMQAYAQLLPQRSPEDEQLLAIKQNLHKMREDSIQNFGDLEKHFLWEDGTLRADVSSNLELFTKVTRHSLKARTGEAHDFLESINSGNEENPPYGELIRELEGLVRCQNCLIAMAPKESNKLESREKAKTYIEDCIVTLQLRVLKKEIDRLSANLRQVATKRKDKKSKDRLRNRVKRLEESLEVLQSSFKAMESCFGEIQISLSVDPTVRDAKTGKEKPNPNLGDYYFPAFTPALKKRGELSDAQLKVMHDVLNRFCSNIAFQCQTLQQQLSTNNPQLEEYFNGISNLLNALQKRLQSRAEALAERVSIESDEYSRLEAKYLPQHPVQDAQKQEKTSALTTMGNLGHELDVDEEQASQSEKGKSSSNVSIDIKKQQADIERHKEALTTLREELDSAQTAFDAIDINAGLYRTYQPSELPGLALPVKTAAEKLKAAYVAQSRRYNTLYTLTHAEDDKNSASHCQDEAKRCDDKVKENAQRGEEWAWRRKADNYMEVPGPGAFWEISPDRYTAVDTKILNIYRMYRPTTPGQPRDKWQPVEENGVPMYEPVIQKILRLKGGGAVVVDIHLKSPRQHFSSEADIMKHSQVTACTFKRLDQAHLSLSWEQQEQELAKQENRDPITVWRHVVNSPVRVQHVLNHISIIQTTIEKNMALHRPSSRAGR